MEENEIDYSKAKPVPDEDIMLSVLEEAIQNPPYDRDRLISDIKSGKISSSYIMSNPQELEKYLL